MGKIFEDILSRMGGFALGRLLPAVILLLLGFAIIKIVLRIVNVMLKKSRLEKAAHSLIRSVIKQCWAFCWALLWHPAWVWM